VYIFNSIVNKAQEVGYKVKLKGDLHAHLNDHTEDYFDVRVRGKEVFFSSTLFTLEEAINTLENEYNKNLEKYQAKQKAKDELRYSAIGLGYKVYEEPNDYLIIVDENGSGYKVLVTNPEWINIIGEKNIRSTVKEFVSILKESRGIKEKKMEYEVIENDFNNKLEKKIVKGNLRFETKMNDSGRLIKFYELGTHVGDIQIFETESKNVNLTLANRLSKQLIDNFVLDNKAVIEKFNIEMVDCKNSLGSIFTYPDEPVTSIEYILGYVLMIHGKNRKDRNEKRNEIIDFLGISPLYKTFENTKYSTPIDWKVETEDNEYLNRIYIQLNGEGAATIEKYKANSNMDAESEFENWLSYLKIIAHLDTVKVEKFVNYKKITFLNKTIEGTNKDKFTCIIADLINDYFFELNYRNNEEYEEIMRKIKLYFRKYKPE